MTMFVSNILGLGKANVAGDETEKKLSNLLLDDSIQVVSSFELNQIASLTYHEPSVVTNGAVLLSEKIFEMLEEILSKPASYSPLTLQKSLVTLKHVLIYGAEKALSSALFLGRHVQALQTYNTILLAQQQSSMTSMFYQLKGGGVDKGGPIRQEAEQVYKLLSNKQFLYYERNIKADPHSLVPIGNNQDVAFVSDDVRLYALKKRMDEQQRLMVRSNLAKADNGFGSGYNSRDGNAVVGAAHGLDEMMKLAEREKQKFTDDGPSIPRSDFADYQAPPASGGLGASNTFSSGPMYNQPADADLLDFGGETSETSISGAGDDNLMGLAQSGFTLYDTPVPAASSVLFNLSVADAPPYGVHSQSQSDHYASMNPVDPYGGGGSARAVSSGSNYAMAAHTMTQLPSRTSSIDPFSVFDSLTTTAGSPSLQKQLYHSDAGHVNANNRPLYTNESHGATTHTTTYAAMSQRQLPFVPPQANIQVSERRAPMWDPDNSDSSNGFVMGGSTGTGLEPLGAAPAGSPPPPPPPPPVDEYEW